MGSKDVFSKVLASSKAWDQSVPQYKALATKMKFTQGYAKDAWDAVVTDKTNVRVLDIACGTGALALPAAEELQNTGGYVLATDFSPNMIESVNTAIKETGLTNIEARVEDGQLFFPQLEKGFSEVFRVLKPGGKVAIVAWTGRIFKAKYFC